MTEKLGRDLCIEACFYINVVLLFNKDAISDTFVWNSFIEAIMFVCMLYLSFLFSYKSRSFVELPFNSFLVLFQTGYKLVVIVRCHFCYCRVGYFRLTEPEGLTYIGSCNERGFHYQNTEVPLIEVCF